ncbi:MAG TPA: hypothetical protein ENH05_02555 [Rhizobiales bacterium]|nr:hypothetical protein BMS3Bbin10_02768 [bacterium BMS3Bbin10]HDO51597.1 hypothetical protein [Hyphomicrobiales bacterium]
MADTDNQTQMDETAAKPVTASPALASAGKRLRAAQRRLANTRHAAARTAARAGAAARSAAAKTARGLRRGGWRSWLALRTFSTQTLLPRLRQSGRWLRRRLHPSSLVRDYRRVLLLVHKLGPDRSVERLFFVRTSKHIPLAVVRIPHQLRRSGHDYRPTPRLVFKWAMEGVPEPVTRYAFVDYGAGRGRVLLMASHYPFEKITGAEIAAELYDDCLLNIAQYPRSLMKCRDVGCEHLSAMRLEEPDQEAVFYLNNPFNRVMLERVVGKITRSYKQNPRRFYVICIDINERALFEDTGIFHQVAIPWRQRLKLAAFSPYSIAIYRSVV